MPDPTNDNDIDALLRHLDNGYWPQKHAALSALVAERDELQSKVNAHAEDRRRYIDAWEGWIASTKRLGIAEWLRVYADAVPIPSLNGDEAKERVFKHLDQRMRDAAETIDELRKRIEELESQPPADRELRERLVCAALTGLCADPSFDGIVVRSAIELADEALAAMREGVSDGK